MLITSFELTAFICLLMANVIFSLLLAIDRSTIQFFNLVTRFIVRLIQKLDRYYVVTCPSKYVNSVLLCCCSLCEKWQLNIELNV